MQRPRFFSFVDKMRMNAKAQFPEYDIHIAHRLSWHSIVTLLEEPNDKRTFEMIDQLTVPARDFGEPTLNGTPKGDSRVRVAVLEVINKYGLYSKQTAKVLNSIPYNLRPGLATENMRIKARPDAHFLDQDFNMTPQSKELLPEGSLESSDFMTLDEYDKFERQFDKLYVKPFLKSVERLL